MNIPNILLWNWSPELIITGVLVLASYLWVNRLDNIRKALLFVSGLLLTVLALALPMGTAPQKPLFSMHMIHHIILLMLAPPLLVAGIPEKPVRKLFSKTWIKKSGSILLNPFVAWILGIGIMWFWHAPIVFNSFVTISSSWFSLLFYGLQIISLLGIGILFCSPVLFPLKEYRLPPLKGIVYLFTACWGCALLGILITFAPTGLYHTVFNNGGSTVVWGLTQEVDQQLGGLLMWIPGCLINEIGAIVLLTRWFSSEKSASQSSLQETQTTNS